MVVECEAGAGQDRTRTIPGQGARVPMPLADMSMCRARYWDSGNRQRPTIQIAGLGGITGVAHTEGGVGARRRGPTAATGVVIPEFSSTSPGRGRS